MKKLLLGISLIASLAASTLSFAENYHCNQRGRTFSFAENRHRTFVCVYNDAWDTPLWCAHGHCGGKPAHHLCHRGGEKFNGGCLSRHIRYFNRRR